jgi:hypothetical protein
MPNPLAGLGPVLERLSKEVSFLPATGGAVEDLLHPEIEEQEDRFVNWRERVFESIIETQQRPLYRPTPPLRRSECHLFKYFLDGSFRSYFLGTAIEHERDTPLHFAQIGAAIIRRENEGNVKVERVKVKNLLLLAKGRPSQGVWEVLEGEVRGLGEAVELVDFTADDQLTRHFSAEADPRTRAAGKVRYKMHELEEELVMDKVVSLAQDWLIADGSLMFEPLLSKLGALPEPKAIGVAKSFRRDPQFTVGRGPKAERFNIIKLLAGLPHEYRTAAFSAMGGKVAFWYVRIREQKHLDYPLMGVVKVELVNPSQEGIDSNLIDLLSRTIVAERSVTPYGLDRRWHAHLYAIHLAEEAVKNALLSREVIRAALRWPLIRRM